MHIKFKTTFCCYTKKNISKENNLQVYQKNIQYTDITGHLVVFFTTKICLKTHVYIIDSENRSADN